VCYATRTMKRPRQLGAKLDSELVSSDLEVRFPDVSALSAALSRVAHRIVWANPRTQSPQHGNLTGYGNRASF
jgi:hypothetical protein